MIKATTKKGRRLLETARDNIGRELYEVYGNYSSAKANAMVDCRTRCYLMKGENFHICSANTFQFTVAWEFLDPENGNMCTHVETRDNIYEIDNVWECVLKED